MERLPLFYSSSTIPVLPLVATSEMRVTFEEFENACECFRLACEEIPTFRGWAWVSSSTNPRESWLQHKTGFAIDAQSKLAATWEAHSGPPSLRSSSKSGENALILSGSISTKLSREVGIDNNIGEFSLKDLEEPLLDSAHLPGCDDHEPLKTTSQLRILHIAPEIIYSKPYGVPVLCFSVIDQVGNQQRLHPEEVDDLYLPTSVKLPISEVEHPCDPFTTTLMVHACDTESMLMYSGDSATLSIVSWLSMVAPSTGIRLDPKDVSKTIQFEQQMRKVKLR